MSVNSIMNIIKQEEAKCEKEKLDRLLYLIKEGKNIRDIIVELNISAYNLGTYLEVLYYKEQTLDPRIVVPKEKVKAIYLVLKNLGFPSLKEVKDKLPNCEYYEIRAVRGAYFRVQRFGSNKVKKEETNKKEVNQESFFNNSESSILPIKVDISSVPYLLDELKKIKTDRWKKFAIELFSKYCPRQFFIMPAAMRKGVHNEVEHTIGEWDLKDKIKIKQVGGKYWHSIRVAQYVDYIIETDSAEIWDFNKTKVINYVYGNEYLDYEEDIMRIAALSHDIYSGGVEDEFNSKRKSMDKEHPYYHRKELESLKKIVGEQEFELYLNVVENHMWKWSIKEPTISFDDGKEIDNKAYEFYRKYRLVKNMELSDYLASKKDNDLSTKLIQTIKTFKYLNIPQISWNDLDKMGFNKSIVISIFGTDDLDKIYKSME